MFMTTTKSLLFVLFLPSDAHPQQRTPIDWESSSVEELQHQLEQLERQQAALLTAVKANRSAMALFKSFGWLPELNFFCKHRMHCELPQKCKPCAVGQKS
jgi:hypothetical protein